MAPPLKRWACSASNIERRNMGYKNLDFLNIAGFHVAVVKPVAFTGGTANARGDKDGTQSAFTLFNVTGDVLVRIFGVCTVDLVGAATLEVGVAGNTAGLIAQVANATTVDLNDIYNDATPAVGVDTLASVLGPYVIVNGLNIIETTAVADITAGNIYYVCLFRPLSDDGFVEAAV